MRMQSESQSLYHHIWHKYRPAILKLMVDAKEDAQQYPFSDHEFKRVSPKNKGKLSFILYVHRSKALNNIKTSPLAIALLEVLQQSKTAAALTGDATYEFLLDDHFVLHIRRSAVISGETAAGSLEVGDVS